MKMKEQQTFNTQRTSAPEPFNPHVHDLSVLSEAEFSDLFPFDAACKATESIRPRGTATDIVNGLTKELPNYLLNREQRKALKKFNKKPLNSFFDHKSWRNQVFKRHPNLAKILSTGFSLVEKFYDLDKANEVLSKADNALTLGGFKFGDDLIGEIKLSCTDSELIEAAENKARFCQLKIAQFGYGVSVYQQLSSFIRSFKISPPELEFNMESIIGSLNRFADPIWWRRKLRQIQAETVEQIHRDFRLVHAKASAYASDFTVKNRRYRNRQTAEMMKGLFVVPENSNPFGDFETLASVVERSHTSGTQQVSEIMTCNRGFEEIADEMGHVKEFYTWSAPSRFHSVKKTGIPNDKYDGSTANECHKYFREIWVKARARFAKREIRLYGYRVVEPHHDGCPHWHLLLFMEKEHVHTVRKILRTLLTEDTPEEIPRSTTRFKPIRIRNSKGSSAGYILKYILKAITGSGLESINCSKAGQLDISPADAAERATAWSKASRIRRFQKIGGPSITLWRELRMLGKGDKGKCEVANAMNTTLDKVSEYVLEKVRRAADSGNWKEFCLAMGGVQVKRDMQPIRIHYHVPDIVDEITGEISRIKSKYGDRASKRILGVAWDSIVVITRRGTSQILTERELNAQRKMMAGVSEQIQSWHGDGRLFAPSEEEMQFLESCAIEDYQNMCLFMDYEALASNVLSDEVAPLDLCH